MSTPKTSPAAASTSDSSPPPSSLARIFGVFVSPGSTFAAIARTPHFVLCWCVQIAGSLGFSLFLLHKFSAAGLARQSLQASARGRAMSPEQLNQALPAVAKGMAYFPYIGTAGVIVILLLMAVIVLGISNLLLGQEARFHQVLALVSHAFLPQTLLAGVAVAVMALAPDPGSVNFTNAVGTNPGYFMDVATASPFLYTLAIHLDLFALWTAVLLALGLSEQGSVAGRKTSFGTAFGAVVALWLVYLLAVAGLAAL